MPESEKNTDVIIIYDSGLGKTVVNKVEDLDTFPEQRTTNLILSNLNLY